MTDLLRSASISLLCLTAFTALASAEGVWVLWEEERWLDADAIRSEIGIILSDGRAVKNLPWLARGTFSNEAACEQGLSNEIKKFLSKGESEITRVVVEGNKIFETVKWRDGLEWKRVLRYICLPDPGVRDPNAIRYRR